MRKREIEGELAARLGGRPGISSKVADAIQGFGLSLTGGGSGGTIFPQSDDYGMSLMARDSSGHRMRITFRIKVEDFE